jgi:hypothetical protein
MIDVKRVITPDYENSGNLYHIEVTTDSALEYQEAMKLLLDLQDQQQNRYKGERF